MFSRSYFASTLGWRLSTASSRSICQGRSYIDSVLLLQSSNHHRQLNTQLRWSSRFTNRSSVPPRPSGGGIPPYMWGTALGATGMIGCIYYAYLEEVPVTNRKRWIATSPKWEEKLGHREYKNMYTQFKKKGQVLPPNHRAFITVKRVGSSIAEAAEKFAQTHEMAHISKAPYTYTVVKSDMANAFVIPGNHVFVFTGLFKYVQNEDDLAAVLGHEMAHNLARHAGEKISGSFVTNVLARLSLLVDPSGAIFTVFLPATKFFRDLPHSRTQESEADQIGVYLAAEACYDPRAAKRVFAAMKEGAEGGINPPEFMSTHPSHDTRISNFDKWLPDAMNIFRGGSFSDGDRCEQVRERMQSARKQAAFQATLREQGMANDRSQ